MATTSPVARPTRVGIFANASTAHAAVRRLLDEGFDSDQVSMICSAGAAGDCEGKVCCESSAGKKSATGAAAGAGLGAVLGSMVVLAGVVTTAGLGVLAAGAMAAGIGGVAGGFIGAMSMRGVQKEYADFYDQAVSQGKFLVAVEDEDPGRLARAESILSDAGAEPIPLPEG